MQVGFVPQPYDYRYEVSDRSAKSGPLQFKKQEKTDSGGTTTGQYSVLLPDGRTQVSMGDGDHQNPPVQTVRYSVTGEGGFLAEVTYSPTARIGRTFS